MTSKVLNLEFAFTYMDPISNLKHQAMLNKFYELVCINLLLVRELN